MSGRHFDHVCNVEITTLDIHLLHDPCWLAAAQDVTTTPVAQERERMSGQCVNILYTYRKFCATASSSGQLILPEALKLLPLYTMGMFDLSPVMYLAMLICRPGLQWNIWCLYSDEEAFYVLWLANIYCRLLIFVVAHSLDQKRWSTHGCADRWEIVLAHPSSFTLSIFGYSSSLPTNVWCAQPTF